MKLLLAVKSCQKDMQDDVHWAIRDTWGEQLPKDIDLFFFIGGEKAPSTLEKDEIYLPVPDGFWELSLKTIAIVRYAAWKDYDFCCLCDNDAYFEFSKLMSSGFEQYDYSGGPIGGDSPILGKPHPGRRLLDYGGVWVSPFYSFMSGHAYILSRKAIQIVASSSNNPTIAEDVLIGQILGPFIGSGELIAGTLPDGKVATHLNCGYNGGNRGADHPECMYDHSLPIPRQNVSRAIRNKYQELAEIST